MTFTANGKHEFASHDLCLSFTSTKNKYFYVIFIYKDCF